MKNENRSVQLKAAECILHLFHEIECGNEYSAALKYLPISTDDLDSYRHSFDAGTYLQLLNIASFNHNGFI